MAIAQFIDLPNPVVITDLHHNIVECNSAYMKMTGYAAEELVGHSVSMNQSGQTPDDTYRLMYHSLHENGSWCGILTNRNKIGTIYRAHFSISRISELDMDYLVGIAYVLDWLPVGIYLSSSDMEDWKHIYVLGVAFMAEIQDPAIRSHVLSVSRYSRILAELYSEQQQNMDLTVRHYIGDASLLHDVGKIKIPKTILYKPGNLTEREFKIMQRHSQYGSEIIESIRPSQMHIENDLFDIAKEICIGHHERWNGTGYPSGIAQNKIPLSARLVAVADVLDALRRRRSYKSAWPDATVRDYFATESGKLFDPVIVKLLLDNWSDVLHPLDREWAF